MGIAIRDVGSKLKKNLKTKSTSKLSDAKQTINLWRKKNIFNLSTPVIISPWVFDIINSCTLEVKRPL